MLIVYSDFTINSITNNNYYNVYFSFDLIIPSSGSSNDTIHVPDSKSILTNESAGYSGYDEVDGFFYMSAYSTNNSLPDPIYCYFNLTNMCIEDDYYVSHIYTQSLFQDGKLGIFRINQIFNNISSSYYSYFSLNADKKVTYKGGHGYNDSAHRVLEANYFVLDVSYYYAETDTCGNQISFSVPFFSLSIFAIFLRKMHIYSNNRKYGQ